MTEMTTAPAPPAEPQPGERSPVWPVLAIWAVMTVALEVFAIFVPAHLMGVAASRTMANNETAVKVFSIAAAPVAALVWAIALYSLVAWRYRGSGPPPEDGPPLRGNAPVQIIWVVVSSVLCLFLFIWGLVAMQTEAQASSAPLVVNVTGQQWVWTFSYPGGRVASSDVLYLPVNRPVVFDVTSQDVVHSFWIVQMGVKIDANPGQITTTSVTPDRLGTYTVRCAELCGLYHAYMVSKVQVVTDAAFRSWLKTGSLSQS